MVGSYDAVLVPTDGSESVDRATEHAIDLATRYDATIHALYVLDDRYLSGDVEGISELSSVESALEDEGERAVTTVADRADEHGLEATGAVRRGVPARTIVEYGNELGVALIAMGTHGRTGLNRILLGSVAERVVRTATVPVLTARSGESTTPTDYSRILIPTDGSDSAARAADHGLALADTYDAEVHALSVVDTRVSQVNPLLGSFRSVAEEAVAAIEERADAKDLPATSEILEGTPAASIRGYAEDHDIDLVTMGTHGRTGLDRFTLGSVAERVVRTAAVPVMTVRQGESD